jgi:Amt family ammonium transporter
MDALQQGANALFILLGAVMVLAMHAGLHFWSWARCGARTKSMR